MELKIPQKFFLLKEHFTLICNEYSLLLDSFSCNNSSGYLGSCLKSLQTLKYPYKTDKMLCCYMQKLQ